MLARAVRLVEEAERIVVLSGAGISVAAGIPDFRSPETGLYHTISKEFGIRSPEDIFDIKFVLAGVGATIDL